MASSGHLPHLGPRERFALRSVAGLMVAVALGAGFGLLAFLVRVNSAPLQRVDQAVADTLNDLVAGNQVLQRVLVAVTDLGGTTVLVWLLVVGVLWLLVRRQPRLAAYVAVTAAGAMILNAVVKELVGRLRPVVETPVYTTPGLSFPSGHAMSSLVSYGVLLLVFAPLLHGVAWGAFIAVVATLVTLIGFTRMALGVHYLSDVLSGWLLGALWLLLTTLAFRRWRQEAHVPATGGLPGEVPPDDVTDLHPVRDDAPPAIPHPWQRVGILAVTWVLLLGVLIGLGILLTGPAQPVIGWDHTIVAWLAQHRDPTLTSLLHHVGALGGTRMIILAALVVAPLAVALTRTWRPVLLLAIGLLGEITLFLATAAIVDRHRPDVPQLNPNLPPTSSFPSGHVAAALVTYTATALLTHRVLRGRWRWILITLAAAVPALVAFQRLYAGVHYPSDVLGSALLALPWIALTWRITRTGRETTRNTAPARPSPTRTEGDHRAVQSGQNTADRPSPDRAVPRRGPPRRTPPE